jgi:hypothetical protein
MTRSTLFFVSQASLAFGTPSLACSLTGLFHQDNDIFSGLYNLTQLSAHTVHLAEPYHDWQTDLEAPWKPVDGMLLDDLLTVNFSNTNRLTEGTVASDCSSITWGNGATWTRDPQNITRIHLIFMTHLDLGFTDTTRNVCDQYFNSFFPKAFETSAELRRRGGAARFRYTQFPWLIQEYLDAGANCAHGNRTEEQTAAMEDAIAHDDVIWHATALNFLPEALDEELWDYSFGMAANLNTRYGKTWGSLAGKHTDTPGMSKSAIPTLAKRGVKVRSVLQD